MKKLMIFVVLLMSGCCSNYSTYANSISSDLVELRVTYMDYVDSDERLSDADRAARESVLNEMEDKTQIAIQDSE